MGRPEPDVLRFRRDGRRARSEERRKASRCQPLGWVVIGIERRRGWRFIQAMWRIVAVRLKKCTASMGFRLVHHALHERENAAYDSNDPGLDRTDEPASLVCDFW